MNFRPGQVYLCYSLTGSLIIFQFCKVEGSDPFSTQCTTKVMDHTSNPASDAVLIQDFIQGNKEAFDLLYIRHLPSVYRRVRYVVPESEVEDLTQEIFIAVMKSLSSFRGDSQFSTWLRSVTNRKIAEFYRLNRSARKPVLSPLSEATGRMEGGTSDRLEQRIFMQRSLQKLPENYREVILLRFAEDLQFSEISEIMNLGLEATKSLYRRAIIALRDVLAE